MNLMRAAFATGSVADAAEVMKNSVLCRRFILQPVAVETSSVIGDLQFNILKILIADERFMDQRESYFLSQRMSLSILSFERLQHIPVIPRRVLLNLLPTFSTLQIRIYQNNARSVYSLISESRNHTQ